MDTAFHHVAMPYHAHNGLKLNCVSEGWLKAAACFILTEDVNLEVDCIDQEG